MKTDILIIDDSQDIQRLIAQYYEMEGYSVEVASNGVEALNKLKSDHSLPNLILLDLMMPEMDGPTFRKQQNNDQRLKEIPTVIMTADAHVEEKAKQLNANGFLKKPIHLRDLTALAKKYCKDS